MEKSKTRITEKSFKTEQMGHDELQVRKTETSSKQRQIYDVPAQNERNKATGGEGYTPVSVSWNQMEKNKGTSSWRQISFSNRWRW